MLVIVSIIGIGLALLIAASIAVLLIKLVVWLVRALALLALATVIAVGLALLARAAGLSDGASVGLGLLLCPLMVWAQLAVIQRRRSARQAAVELFHEEPVLPLNRYAGPAEPKADKGVVDAWKQLAEIVPTQRVDELHRARASCARLLTQETDTEFDVDIVETRVLIRRSLPELAKRSAAVWKDADDTERAQLGEQVLGDICLLGDRAARQLGRHGDAVRDSLSVIRNHIGARAGV